MRRSMKKKFRFKVGDTVICIADKKLSSNAYLFGHTYGVRRVYYDFGEERISTVLDSKGSITNGWSAKYFIPARQYIFDFGE